jgi:peptide/nickel transport system substrate-binding protein
LTYTFTLREGLRWSDGAPLTSDDFEFTYRVLTDPGVPNSRKDLFRQGKDAKGKARFPLFEKVDQRTFKFSLFQIDVLFHSNLAALYVVPKHIWRETFEAGKFNKAMTLQTPPAKLVSSGPFLIKSFRTDERVVLERNPHFWKVDQKGARLPYVDRVIFVIVPDFNAKLLKFREGETDIHDVRPEEFQILKRKEAQGDYVVVDLGAGFNTSYVMFNLDDRKDKSGKPFVDPIKLKWFVNVAFRKAVSHAIDREGLVRTVLSGRGEPLWCYVSPANKRWYSETVIKYPYDLERAAAILREAGFSFREAKLFDAQDNRVAFSIITNAENATRIAMLNVIKDDLEKLGISVSIRPVPFNDVVTSIRDARNFDAVLLGWATGVPPDPSFFKNVILSSGRSHVWRPEQAVPGTEWEAKMDALLYKNTGTFDYAERKKYSDELFRIFSDKLPQVMLVVGQDAAAARKNIGNFSPSSLRPKTHWNIEQLFFTTPKRR